MKAFTAASATWLAALGFDVPRLLFGVRTAFASCVALFAAWHLGLEHPQWSAVTVWAASQPVRGMLIEKSFLRAVGTFVGTGFGMLLMFLTGGDTLLLVLGIVLWVAFCAGAGNVLSGLVSYGTLLAGYSASTVVLLGSVQPMDIQALGLDRLYTVLLGVLVALAIGLMSTSRLEEDDLGARVRRVCSMVLRHLAASAGSAGKRPSTDPHDLLPEIAAIEEDMEAHGAGSLRSRQSARSLRAVLSAQVEAILWLKRPVAQEGDESIAAALEQAALALHKSTSIDQALVPLEEARSRCDPGSGICAVIGRIGDALRQRQHYRDTGVTHVTAVWRQAILHRDWTHARHAGVRAGGLLLLIGLIWVATGWEMGAYMLLSTSVMVTLFSTFERPSWIMGNVLAWQVVGAAAALGLRWLAWPLAGSERQMLWMIVPFIILGLVPFAHRRTTTGSVDYIMVLLLLSRPVYPPTATFAESVTIAAAVVAGPLLAFLAFKLVFPTNAKRRRRSLIEAMIRELQDMASDHRAPVKRRRWELRLHHRVLKLVHWSGSSGSAPQEASGAGAAVLEVGHAVITLRELLQEPSLPVTVVRPIRVTLERLRKVGAKPDKAARALARLGRRLRHRHPSIADQLEHASSGLLANRKFFAS